MRVHGSQSVLNQVVLCSCLISALLKSPSRGLPTVELAYEAWKQMASSGKPLDAIAYLSGKHQAVITYKAMRYTCNADCPRQLDLLIARMQFFAAIGAHTSIHMLT